MVEIRSGCVGFAASMDRLFEQIQVVEVEEIFYSPPRPATIRQWRTQAPPDFEFVVRAFQAITHPVGSPTYQRLQKPYELEVQRRLGFFQDSEEVRQAWATTAEAARVLEAKVVLFQTPALVTPSSVNMERMRRFFREVDRQGLLFAWEPFGVWGEEDVEDLCDELDLIHVVDPLIQGPMAQHCLSHGPVTLFHIGGIPGHRDKLNEHDRIRLLEACLPFSKVYCLFANQSRLRDAVELRELVETLKEQGGDLEDLEDHMEEDDLEEDDLEEDDLEEDDLEDDDDLEEGEEEEP